jgi:hypothetical protein
MIFTRKLALAVAVLSLYACSKSSSPSGDVQPDIDKSNRIEPSPKTKALDYSMLSASSFSSLAWDQKCQGVKDFVRNFVQTYLDSKSQTEFEVDDCAVYTSNPDFVVFQPRAKLISGDSVLPFTIQIQAKFDEVDFSLDATSVSLEPRFTDRDLLVFGANLSNFKDTLADWVLKVSDSEVSVFGRPYSEYAAKFAEKFGPNSEGLKIEKNPMVFKLIPKQGQPGKGTVEFVSIDPAIFSKVSSDGTTIETPFLGCTSIGCLNSSEISYNLLGIDLVLSTQPTTSGSLTKKQISIFRFSDFNW